MLTQQAQKQYNALLLLTSYLQRVYVSEMVKETLKKKTNSRAQEAKALLDDVTFMREVFESSKALVPTQVTKLLETTYTVIEMMADFLPTAEDVDFDDQLTVVAASLFGEQAMNDGILRMQHVFQIEIKGDFKARVPFYQDRTQAMDKMIVLREKGEAIAPELTTMIEQWFANIRKNPQLVLADLHRIKNLLV